jgi:RimJ/RimL family protein N-acetyltransferase
MIRGEMEKVDPRHYRAIQQLFATFLPIHFSIGALLAGDARGEVWVDDLRDPQVGYAITTEGYYLVGNSAKEEVFPALRNLIPHFAYLVVDSEGWENVLGAIWNNPFARKHIRWNYQFDGFQVQDWRDGLPPGFKLVPIDQVLLSQSGLQNFHQIKQRLAEWKNVEDFLQRGFGNCIIHEQAIVSRSMVDCVSGNQCELGVGTDSGYRKRGLATVVVAETVKEGLSRGYTQIGWHCLASNQGSMAVAEKVGFRRVKQYIAFSSELPAENPGDLSAEEYVEWAKHYERASQIRLEYALYAAGAWALSGNVQKALANLERLTDGPWQGKVEWIERNWMLSSLHDLPAYHSILSRLGHIDE